MIFYILSKNYVSISNKTDNHTDPLNLQTITLLNLCLFSASSDVLRFFSSHVSRISWVEPVLSSVHKALLQDTTHSCEDPENSISGP